VDPLATDFFVVKWRFGCPFGAGVLRNHVHIAVQHFVFDELERFAPKMPFKFIALQHCPPLPP
jgi:hypothetical protein